MSKNYGNWERLVRVVLRREQDREIALIDSSDYSSISCSSDSELDYDHDQIFQIPISSDPMLGLKRWRQAARVLNASRRFRYTLDLKEERERKQLIAKLRAHAEVTRIAVLFKAAGQERSGSAITVINGLSRSIKSRLNLN